MLFEWIGSVVGRGRFSSAYKLGESVSDQAWKWVQHVVALLGNETNPGERSCNMRTNPKENA